MYKQNKVIIVLMSIFMILILNLIVHQVLATKANRNESEKIVIVIDPGHGGFDPGKIGVNDCLEKDINLSISKNIKNFLEQQNIEVILTRETDIGLYNENDSNKKRADLYNRVKIIKESNAKLVLSIHQNSFTEEKYKGAQVFYYDDSNESKSLADNIQSELIRFADDSNKRVIKPNDSYYLLKQTPCPAVIVECGFLSNYEEAELLLTESYQNDIAWSIYMGVMKYLNECKVIK